MLQIQIDLLNLYYSIRSEYSANQTSTAHKKALILTDSLGRDMQCLNPDIDIVFLSGATITGMRVSLPNLSQYSCILLLVGTNDFDTKMGLAKVQTQYEEK